MTTYRSASSTVPEPASTVRHGQRHPVDPMRERVSPEAAQAAAKTLAAPDADAARSSEPQPALPHELDQSPHSQARASARQVEAGKQAYADEIGPGEDTDRQPVMNELYKRTAGQDRPRKPAR